MNFFRIFTFLVVSLGLIVSADDNDAHQMVFVSDVVDHDDVSSDTDNSKLTKSISMNFFRSVFVTLLSTA